MNSAPHDSAHAPHVAQDPWPPVAALGYVLMAFGLALSFSFRRLGMGVLALGAVLALVGTVGWWRHLVAEAEGDRLPTAHAAGATHRPEQDMRLGMILFITSELMFFAAFFSYYFYTRFGAAAWPPVGVPLPVESLALPSVLTVVLVSSSLTYTWAEQRLMRDDRRGLVLGLAATVLLGVLFVGGQIYEWSHSPLSIRQGTLGTAFYMLTGFHGVHVVVGVIFIAVNLARALAGHFSRARHFAIQGAGWYWHFVDAIWLLLFFGVLYVPLLAGRGS